ncbi:TSUP family transporter [Pseudoduganella eburnea]|uniref:Probable membrane transporter protein n=1 Tax=Massilia eburnea TaxID=1776165 RepID=A0A6L6QMD0_9BURK|nr:sulfite exporter TauE/SafE family protein [Massilia eburnea]MTW13542.1 TSUP family transporter [Massilia eburnea]
MLLAIALGMLVGLVMGLTGAGGGIIAVPLLMFGLGLPLVDASPIGLLAVALAAGAGALSGLRLGLVRYRAALLVASAGMVSSPFGLWLARRLDLRFLSLIFAGVLLWVAYRNVMAGRPDAAPARSAAVPCVRDAATGRFIWTSPCATRLTLAGCVAGVLSGLLGVGGGFVMVPALQRYTDLAMQSVVRTSLAVIALISLSGVAAAFTGGHLAAATALPFGLGATAGMLAGGKLSGRLPGAVLKTGFGAICAVVAAGMAWRALA